MHVSLFFSVVFGVTEGNIDFDLFSVTHGCIIATVKLYYPNGKEADSRYV